MFHLIIRLIINALALWVAIRFVPGLTYEGSTETLLLIALIFGIVNAFVRPFILLLTCPLVILTLGFFILVVNTLMLSITVWLAGPDGLGLGLSSSSFWATFFGAVIISVVSGVLNTFVKGEEDHARHRRDQ